jgi:hypothetical protein
MRPSATTLTTSAAVLGGLAALALTGAAADAKPSCKPKKEHAGCVLTQAAYQAGDTPRASTTTGKSSSPFS